MDSIQLVVFDLAGTTVRDDGQVPRAFVSALSDHGIGVTPEQVNAVRGASKRQAILHFIPVGPDREARAADAYATFRERLSVGYRAGGVEPIDGAEDVFRWLRGHGVQVAFNTGFDRDITTLLLTTLGWEQGVADAVVCGDDVENGRPAPDLILRAMSSTGTSDSRGVVNAGDTVLDLEAGRNAGVGWSIGVLSGAHDRALLERAPHTHLLGSVKELKAVLESATGERAGPPGRPA
jgi:phosphonatase-like hydrolase